MRAPDFGRLRWRLLGANLVVAAAGVVAVMLAARLSAPRAFEDAMGRAGTGMMGTGMGTAMGADGMMDPALRSAFGDAVGSALLLGLGVAVVVAAVVAVMVSTRISRPIADLAAASERVAGGDYGAPVPAAPGEMGELAAAFNGMAASLAANEQRRRDLVGDVAHELRTPIASLRGYVEGLQAGVFAPGPAAWRVLDEQTARLEHLVDDLAVLWHAEAHGLRLAIETLDAATLLADAVERHLPLAEPRSIHLALDAAPRVAVLADPVRVAQVLDNLVTNALRYTPSGGHVVLGVATDGAAARITVRDDGPGLSADQAAQVFERFYRADPSRSRDAGGSGLGLAISRSLADAMGGSLAVASEGPGRGATFTLRLPRG